MVLSCLVQIQPGVTRLIAISATSLASSPVHVFSAPLDIPSLHHLSRAFARISTQVEVERKNDIKSRNQCHDGTPASVANSDRKGANRGFDNGDSDLPNTDTAMGAGEKV